VVDGPVAGRVEEEFEGFERMHHGEIGHEGGESVGWMGSVMEDFIECGINSMFFVDLV
jgi:hypothetical protein